MTENVRLLIIDDEEIVIAAIKRILRFDQTFKYIIDFSHTAEDGLKKLSSNSYDIILSDIIMPGMDGMELLRKIVDKKIFTQIIMITGFATMKTALMALKMGAFDFLAKPFTKDELFDSIHRALQTGPQKSREGENNLKNKQLINATNIYLIQNKSWAKVLDDYSVHIGIENKFLDNIKKIKSLELLQQEDEIVQGYGFVKIVTVIDNVYTIPSPFSGKVLGINERILNNSDFIYDLDEYDRWLLHIEPKEIENEVSNLALKNENEE
jgi:YesN/AraC family two-component response regulator